MGFDKLDFRFVQTVFFIKLLVDFGDGFCPVNVGGGSEVLERDVFPFLRGITSVAKDRKAPSGGKSRTREADDAAIFA